MNRGHVHKIAADLLQAFAATGLFYGWAHKQRPEFQEIALCVAKLSTKHQFFNLPALPRTRAILKKMLNAAQILRDNWIGGDVSEAQFREIDRKIKIVRQEYKIITAAEILKHGKTIE
jgi:hypothetical protein